MAIARLREIYKNNLKEAMKNYGDYARNLGTGVLVEYLLLAPSILESCKKGTKLVAEKLNPEGQKVLYTYNTDKVWLKIIKKRLKLIYKLRRFGSEPLKTYRQWQVKHPPPGVYLANPAKVMGSKGGRDNLILLIWCDDPVRANNIVKSGTNILLKFLWDDFQKVLNKPLPSKIGVADEAQMSFGGDFDQMPLDLTQGVSGIDYDDPMRQRPSKRFKEGRLTKVKSVFRQGAASLEHGRHSTKVMFALQNELKDLQIPYIGTDQFRVLKVTPWLMKNIVADWGQKVTKKQYAKYGARSILTLRLGVNEPLPTDLKDVMDKATEYIAAEVLEAEGGLLGDIDISASKPLKDQIAEDVMKDIIKPLTTRPRTKSGAFDMRFKVNRGLKNLKNFKNISRKENLGKAGGGGKAFHTKTRKISIAGKLPSGKGVEGGEGQQASVSQAADLARLRTYIQGRLPAEVRRNMGRPALQNRTGRFSNSVKLLSLTEGRNTLMAKYTYLLRPYETFENKGKKRWPMAYNPKPLIAKSIRNLAQGRIEQKLTVRRV
jgi:hypothetical protein